MPNIDNLSRFKAELNEAQYEAVTYCDGPSLVIAGAGSGKTRVLTYKVAYLLQCGVLPQCIMALTFTNKAAREMNERIGRFCQGSDLRGLWSGTFHSLFARLLRIESAHIGYPADYTIYDTTDQRSLIKSIVKEMQLDDKKYKPSTVAARISEAKNHLILPPDYERDTSIQRRDSMDGLDAMPRIYATYQQRLKAASAMDFDDLLLNTYLLLSRNAEICERYRQRFQFILVDEYQDTNMAQHRILSLLTTPDSRICVVGDDAQSIYGFRGADISNILRFAERYPKARIIKLECNYRSTQCIVEAANSIISHNTNQIHKKVYASGAEGEKLHLFAAQSDKEEALMTASRVMKLYRSGVPFSEMALLYRTNAQSRSFEETFQKSSIPYRIYGGLSFYMRKEIKDVLAYCRLVCNTADEEAFRRIVNYPARGIGATTIAKLQTSAAANGISLWEAANNPAQYGLAFNRGTLAKLEEFCRMITHWRGLLATCSAYDLAVSIVRESGIGREVTADKSPENIARQENIDELLGSIRAFEKERQEEVGDEKVSLADFLSSVSLITDADQEDDGTPKITLMTVHAAKGLEFDAVFVTGLEENLFPNANARLYPKEMEEERRLFYVAVTRAKRFCYLSYARTRYKYGNVQFGEASPFLNEIDSKYIEKEETSFAYHAASSLSTSPYAPSRGSRPPQPWEEKKSYASAPHRMRRIAVTSPSAPTSRPIDSVIHNGMNLRAGVRILHERFGKGTITQIEGNGNDLKITVAFDNAGTKRLLVKFSRFTLTT